MTSKRWKRRLALTAASAACALLASLCATTPARAEWQAQVGLGWSWTDSSDIRIRQGASDYTFHNVGWSGRGLEIPPWYDLRVTYFLPRQPSLGFTIGLLHYKAYARLGETRRLTGVVDGTPVDTEAPVGDYLQQFNISHGANFVELGVVGRLRWRVDETFPEGRVQPYLVLSTGPVVNHAENVVQGVPNERKYHQNHEWGTQAMLGVQYGLTHDWKLYSEVKRTHVNEDVNTATGRAETTLDATHLAFGFVYVF